MYCENCGHKNDESHKYCTKCGYSISFTSGRPEAKPTPPLSFDERWWHRLLKVVYIFLYLQILWIVPVVWSEDSTYYNSYYSRYEDTPGEAFWYSVLAIVIFVVVLRLIKLTTLYIFLAQKPEWNKEFWKLF
jgi:hypothetical protein